MKNFFNNILIGFKKAWDTPTLPAKVLAFNDSFLIRVFRVVGGLSFIFVLGRFDIDINIYKYYIIFLICVLFFIYHIVLFYIRVKHIYRLIRSDELNVRNSPLNVLASISARTFMCLKGVCSAAQPVGLTLGLMLGTDDVLVKAGREELFKPLLAEYLNKILPPDVLVKKTNVDVINSNLDELAKNKAEMLNFKSLEESIGGHVVEGGLSVEEAKELQSAVREVIRDKEITNSEIKNKILEEIKKNSKK